MSPLVSVVIPTYNVAPYVEEGIGSLLRGTMPDFEALVVDGGSTDGTLDAVRALGDARIRVMTPEGIRGVSHARNVALDHARAPFVTLLDADDFYLPRRLERLVEAAEAHRADVVADNVFSMQDGERIDLGRGTRGEPGAERPLPRLYPPRLQRLTAGDFLEQDSLSPLGQRPGLMKPLFRKSFLDQHGLRYDERIRQSEDVYLYLRALLAGAAWVRLPEAYYVYREGRPGAATAEASVPSNQHRLDTARRLRAEGFLDGAPALLPAWIRRERAIEHALHEGRFLAQSAGRPSISSALGDPRGAASFALRESQKFYGRTRGRVKALRNRLGPLPPTP